MFKLHCVLSIYVCAKQQAVSFHIFSHLICKWPNRVACYYPHLQMRKPNFKEVKWLAQDQVASKRESNGSNLVQPSFKSKIPLYLKHLEEQVIIRDFKVTLQLQYKWATLPENLLRYKTIWNHTSLASNSDCYFLVVFMGKFSSSFSLNRDTSNSMKHCGV